MCLSHTCRSEHLVLPVDTGTVAIFACYTVISACIEVGVTYAATKKACESILVATKSLELILILHVILNAKQVELLAKALETYITIVRNLSLAGLTALGSNKDYTIGTSSTINSGSRSILHHIDGLDIVDIDISQTIFHLETIHDVERLGALCDRRTATHCNVDIGTWRTTLGNDVHTGSLTCQSLSGRSGRYIGKILTADRGCSCSQVSFLYLGITNRNNLIEHLSLGLKLHIDLCTTLDVYCLCLVTYIRNNQRFGR